jgi:hypothetical protein
MEKFFNVLCIKNYNYKQCIFKALVSYKARRAYPGGYSVEYQPERRWYCPSKITRQIEHEQPDLFPLFEEYFRILK